MAANYDSTAWFYEPLSKLIFGQTQIKAQAYFLNLIKPQSHILIIGGGTGQILESLTSCYPSSLQITYVEISARMLALSKKRNTGKNEVTFVEGDVQEMHFTQSFNVIITAFLFDNFSDQELRITFPQIHQALSPGGLWLNTDFQLTGPVWQKLMLKTMYTFFRIMGAVRVQQLPDVKRYFIEYGYYLVEEKAFYGKFIISSAYRRI